jgi:four helix bundle protein
VGSEYRTINQNYKFKSLKSKTMETTKKIETFKDLLVWQKAMNLTTKVYQIVKKLPKEERYSLSDQMRRAAVSIPSNIAEGYGRHTPKEYVRFLSIARGSAFELETQLLACEQIHYLSASDIQPHLAIISELTKMLSSLIHKILSINS